MALSGQGFAGLNVQTRTLGSALAGLFGLSIQTRSNTLLEVVSTGGGKVLLARVTISYADAGTPVSETLSYSANNVYNRSFPDSTPITVTVTAAGYVSRSQSFTRAVGGFLTMRVALTPTGQPLLTRRRLFG